MQEKSVLFKSTKKKKNRCLRFRLTKTLTKFSVSISTQQCKKRQGSQKNTGNHDVSRESVHNDPTAFSDCLGLCIRLKNTFAFIYFQHSSCTIRFIYEQILKEQHAKHCVYSHAMLSSFTCCKFPHTTNLILCKSYIYFNKQTGPAQHKNLEKGCYYD